ncbi:MAG: CotH kinase family protein, partial [Kiritimatiellae bacterium]|nr:CotH kinase family protein [Kiritimatiellia bacterium]
MRKQISTWLAILLPSLLTAKIVINEVQSSNDETCLDEYGVSSDWIELYNTGSTAVDLSGWGISDNAEKPFKWSFPEGTKLNANGHLRLFASGRETVKEEETALAEPTDFAPNLVLWLRGDDFSGRNQGARISRWTDRSGWGNNATQMLSRAPTVSLNAINGHTALSFNRSSRQHLLLPKDFKGMSSLSNVTIMVACKWGGTANSGLFGQWASGSSSQNAHFEIQSNGTLRWRVADSDLKVNTAVTPDVWMTLGAITDCDRETPTLSLIKDGLLLQSQVKAIGKQSFSSADLIYIGDSCNASNDSSGRFWDGLIAEVVIINRALTEQEWKGLAAYFAQKYDGSVRVNHHLPFRLGSEGETLTLSQPDGSVADQLTFGSLPCDTSYGRSPSGGEAFAWFATPTPEAANTETAYDAPLEPVSFSVERGLYETPLSLTLSHPDPAATIVYTLDYSEPSPSNGVRYAGETLTIAHTASVRAWASKPGALPYRSIQTHSYIFLSDVPTQTDVPAGCPTVWTSGGSTAATYGISTQVVATPDDVIALTNALRQLPILSLAIPMENVFGADHGVYSHATDDTLEEATSAEWITNGVGFVQIDAGLKAQGAASREFGKTPKKPLRLCFRGRYGFNRLKTPVLQDVGYPCDDFNTLVLRAEYNNAWTHSDSTQRARGSNIRDQWIRDTQQCMSGYQSHGDHVHLFINGRYWGISNVAERVDASLAANLFGGEKEEYDGLAYEASNGVKARDGDTANWTLLRSLAQADLTVQANYEAVAAMIDLPAFADYMMLNFFGGNQDWPGNNFAMVCSRLPGGQFYFVGWDMERTLENVSDNRLSASFANGPKGIHDRLKTAPEYTLLFADRVHKHLFNGGALTAESTVPRYRAFTEKLRPAIFAEAARWGGYRLENNTASKRYGLSDWESEQNRILNTYLPQRPARFLSQLQSDGLYPSLAAPEFTETVNGAVSVITLSVPSGATVFYTLEGSDPRTAFSGAAASAATRYTQPFTVTATTRIKARAYLNGTWSALSEYTALADRERAVFIQPDEGNWDKDDNWSTGTYPDGAGGWAVIPVPTGLDEDGKRNVRINKKPVTIGHIEIYNGSATNRICNKKDAAEGSTLTFDGGDEPATLTVADSGGGMTVVDVNYGVILANDLRLIVSNATGHAEYGALRLQQGWSGAGGLIKEGPGLCSLTGEGKTYTGDTLIREGVITLTAKSIPTATRSISVEPGGQLRLVGGNASYPFPCPITISGFGRDMALGDGMNRQGALRYTPTSAKNSPV